MIIKCDFRASSSDLFPLGTFLSVLLQTINLYNVENIINVLTRYILILTFSVLIVFCLFFLNYKSIQYTQYYLHTDKISSSIDFFSLSTFLSILLQL